MRIASIFEQSLFKIEAMIFYLESAFVAVLKIIFISNQQKTESLSILKKFLLI